jgi:hypothetical protein
MTKINIFPVINYPNELYPIVITNYNDSIFNKYKDYAYRIGNKLYLFGEIIEKLRLAKGKVIFQTENEDERKVFSLLLRRLTLYGIVENINKSMFFIPNNVKNTSRLIIQKIKPSIETEHVLVYERLELQSIHWQEVNFGIIVNYRTINEWHPIFKDKVGDNPCSYQNIRKYVPEESANELLFIKIPELRSERYQRKWRGDALKQKFMKIRTLFKEALKWEETKNIEEIILPTGQSVKISDEFINVILLG